MHNPLAEQSSNDTANQSVAQLPQVTEPRNPGMELDLDWVARVQANTSAIERRCAALPARRSVKKEHQAAWLLKAVSCIDLTTLSGDDTEMRVGRLCAKARQPVNASVLAQLEMTGLTTGAVCVTNFGNKAPGGAKLGTPDRLILEVGASSRAFAYSPPFSPPSM